MTITIDCRHIDSSGIGVYLRECLPFFLDSDNYFNLIGCHARLDKIASGRNNCCLLECEIKPFSLKDTFAFPKKLLGTINRGELFYSPFFNIPNGIKVPVYTTIHDIIFPDMPELTSRIGLKARMFFFRRCYKKSKKIFTVSGFSKLRIAAHLGEGKPTIVTYSAIQPWILEQAKNSPEKNKTIVFVGNIKKHKGLDCLLEAFRLARNEGLQHKLVIIGSRDNFRSSDNSVLRKIDSLGKEAVLFTGFISNQKLAAYLSACSLLVQPSLYEGFGLPPLEAMVLGTQALISDIPVFREIYNDFPVFFFHSGDCLDLKEKMLAILSQNAVSVSLPEQLISKYTFQKTASTILSEFNS